jgi:hypothetical protein
MANHETMLADLEKQLSGLEEQIEKLLKADDPATVKPDGDGKNGKFRRFRPKVPADDDVMNKAKSKNSDDDTGDGDDDEDDWDGDDDGDGDGDDGDDGDKAKKAAPKEVKKDEPKKAEVKKTEAKKAAPEEIKKDEPKDEKIAKEATVEDETLEVNGQMIAKSAVGETQFAIFKAQQEAITKAHEELAKERDRREMVELKKRADDEFEAVPGSLDERANMLRAIGKMDEALRKSFEKVFKQSQALANKAFETLGYQGGREGGTQTFETKVSEIKKRDNCTRQEAMQKARQENPAEFADYQASGAQYQRDNN